jgi:predicted O-linked N-acetylglucosamine transferase (SPINDLY family)
MGCGDCGSSSEASTSISNTTLNQQLTDILIKTATTVSTSVFANQSINLLPCSTNPDKFVANCGTAISVIENMTGTMNLVTSVTTDQSTALAAAVNSAIAQNAASSSNANSQFLSTSSSTAKSATDVKNYIQNLVSTKLSTTTIYDIISTFDFRQIQNIYLCGTWNAASCTFNANMQLSLIADTIISTANTAVSNDSFLNTLTQVGGAQATSTAGGIQGAIDAIAHLVDSIVATLESPFVILMLVVGGGIGLIVLLILLFRFLSKPKQERAPIIIQK